jgi:hypothetical protein
MRTKAVVLAVAAGATWSFTASAQDAASFRGLELGYLNAEVGGAYVNVGDQFTNQGGQGGAAVGVGAGLRFVYFTVGLRGRIAPLSAFTLYEGNLELGIHVPEGAWDPYINIHGGYARASMNTQEVTATVLGTVVDLGQTPPSPSGGDFGGSLGTDYYFSALFSLGLDATLDALILSTGATTVSSGALSVQIAGQSNTGIAFIGSVHAGLHFDL